MLALIRAVVKPIVYLGRALDRLDRLWDSLISGVTCLVLLLAKAARAIDDSVIDGFVVLMISLARRISLLVRKPHRAG